MSNKITYKYGISRPFHFAKCVGILTGDYLDVAAVPDDVAPIDGSENVYPSKEILLVLAGSFQLQTPEAGNIDLNAGDMSSSHRYKSAIKIVATADGSSYVCVTPNDNSFWDRQSGFIANGDTLEITTPAEAADAYVYVGEGGVVDAEGNPQLVGAFIRVSGGITLTATADTYFIHMWK